MGGTLHANSTATVIIAVLFVLLCAAACWLGFENRKLKKKYLQTNPSFRMTKKLKKSGKEANEDEPSASPLNQNEKFVIDLPDQNQN